MSRLDDIREQLYRKKPDGLTPPPRDYPLPRDPSEGSVKGFWTNVVPRDPNLLKQASAGGPKRPHLVRDLAVLLGGLTLVAVGAWTGYIIFFPSANVEFSILGPAQVTAGEPTVFTVRASNHSNVALREVVATITFPPGTAAAGETAISTGAVRTRLELPDIPAGGETQKEIRVRPFGVLGQDLAISSVLLYRPDNIQSKLTRTSDVHVNVARLPVVVTVDEKEQASSGQDYTITIGVDSELSQSLSGLSLGVDVPDGFTLKSSNPDFAEGRDHIWPLPELTSGTSQKFVISGTIRGDPGEAKSFHIRLGRYEAITRSWFILSDTTTGPTIASPFLLAQATLNGARQGVVTPGARIDGNVSFKNNLLQKVENVTILLTFPEKFVALESVRGEHGFYDVTNQTLTWNPASEPRLQELSPGEEGTLAFSFTMKREPPIKSFSDKNFMFPVNTTIDTASPPPDYKGVLLAYHDRAEFKIKSRLSLAAGAYYYNSSVPNTGPLPPKVRRKTSYTISFSLTSGANDLNNVEVHGIIPGGVVWKGPIASDRGTFDFNPSTQEMVWKISQLPAATGILRPPIAASVQLELTPAENQVNSSPVLMQGISATGRDTFANTTETAKAENLTTELFTDKKSTGLEWRVVP